MRNSSDKTITGRVALALYLFLLVALLFALFYASMEGCAYWTVDDWATCFRPAARRFDNPYEAVPSAYPVWYFVALSPLAVLPVHLGHGVLTALSLLVLIVYVKDWWRAVLLVLSTPVLVGLLYGQIDALLTLAFMIPTDYALLVVSMKPIALLGWGVRKWLASKHPFYTMIPVVSIFLASYIVWGPWWDKLTFTGLAVNHSLDLHWPAMIPIGILLLLTKDERLWLVGSLFLTPFLMRYHLTPLLAYFYRRERWYVLVIVTVVTWLFTWYGGF